MRSTTNSRLAPYLSGEFVRYVLVGGTNTALTYLIYRLLLLFVPYGAAYTLAYLCGIFIAYVLNARFVFHQPLRWRVAIRFPLVYLVQYLVGVALLAFAVAILHSSDEVAPLVVIAITVPLTFVLSRLIIKGRAPTKTAGS